MTRKADLETAAKVGHARWPALGLSVERFIVHLEERLGPEDDPSALQIDDLFLVSACLDGHESAWRELDRLYLSRVPSFVARIDPSEAFGEEVRQRLAEKLLVAPGAGASKLTHYTGRGALGGWLRVAAVREAHNSRRTNKPTVEPEDQPLVAADADPEMKLAKVRYAAAFKTAFQDVLRSLPSDRRNVLRLHYLDGLTLEQVGKAYGVSRATAARWTVEARESILAKIRVALAADLGRGGDGPASILALIQSQLDLSLQRQFSLREASDDDSDDLT